MKGKRIPKVHQINSESWEREREKKRVIIIGHFHQRRFGHPMTETGVNDPSKKVTEPTGQRAGQWQRGEKEKKVGKQ